MTTDEARFILASVRPGSADAGEVPDAVCSDGSQLAEALELVRTDDTLRAWYEDHCRFDEAVRDRFSAIQAPADLHSSILAGLNVTPSRPWWQRPGLMAFAAAAAVALFAVIGIGVNAFRDEPDVLAGTDNPTLPAAPDTDEVADFQRSILSQIEGLQKFDFEAADTALIGDWIHRQGSPALSAEELPEQVAGIGPKGCKLLEWKGHRASLICFIGEDEQGNKTSYHLVVTDGDMLKSLADGEPASYRGEGWNTATWRQGTQIALLATRAAIEPEDLPALVL